MNLVVGRVDKLSLVFAWVFVIMAFGAIFTPCMSRKTAIT